MDHFIPVMPEVFRANSASAGRLDELQEISADPS